MSNGRRWSQSMRQAWSFVQSSVIRGLSGAEGLRQFRAGGGAIRDSDWYFLRRLASQTVQVAEQTAVQPRTLPVPEESFTPTDWDYRQNYVSVVEVVGKDAQTGQRVVRHITVESDSLLSLESWAESALDVMEAEAENYGIVEFSVGRMYFYRRATPR